MGDTSSDDMEEDDESEDNEELKLEGIKEIDAKVSVNDVPLADGQREKHDTNKEDHKILLRQMSSNFSVRYRHLDLRSNPEFKDQPPAYKDNLRAWYNYYYKLYTKEQDAKIPKPRNNNLLLAGLFRDDEVDTKLGHYLASILEKFADKKVLA